MGIHHKKPCSILIFSLTLGMMMLFAQVRETPAKEGTGRDLFAVGNQAYVKGDYDQAILHYNAAMERDGYAPSLLYNLGNAYYMKNEMGQSILNYERALYLDPGNADIKTNLALARKNAGLIMPSQTSWKAFFNRVTLNGWTWMAVIALCVFSLMVLLHGMRPGILRGHVLKIMTSACCLFFLTAGAGIVIQYQNLDRGVITHENARLRVSPFDSAADSGAIKDGEIVQVANTYEGYVFVKAENGKSGWISKGAVKSILPLNEHHQTRTSLTQSTISKNNGNGGKPETDNT